MNYNESDYIECIKKSSAKEICIYGAGNYGGILLDYCERHFIPIKKICVKDSTNNRSELKGIPVVNVTSLDEKDDELLILIAAKGNDKEEIPSFLRMIGRKNYFELPEWIKKYDRLALRRYSAPIIEVTPSIGCRIQCKYCPQTLLLNQYFKTNRMRETSMSFEIYKDIINKLPHEMIIDFSGFVEPFQNPEAIDMMEYTFERGFEETLYTTLKDVNCKIAERVLKIPFSVVVLHVADEEGNSNIPVTEEYLEVLQMIIRAKKTDGTPFVREANCHGKIHPKVKEILKGHVAVSNDMMDRAGNLKNNTGLITAKELSGHIRCIRSKRLDHNVLLPDGTLVLCCNDYGMKHVLGNLKRQTYYQIMNGPEIDAINDKLMQNENNDLLCRKCIYAVLDESLE